MASISQIADGESGLSVRTKLNSVINAVNSIDEYNVKLYGLVGDGSTNDRAALNTLMNTTAPSGSTIKFPAGTYLIDTTTISVSGKRFNLKGEGAIIKTTSNISIFTVATTASDNAAFWTVEGIRFEGNSTGTSQTALTFNSSSGGFSISNCVFTLFGGKAVMVNNTVNSAGTKYIGGRIVDCTFISNLYGCDFSNRAEYMQVSSTNFYNTLEAAIQSTSGNMTIDGACNISYGKDGIIVNAGTNNDHSIISGVNLNHNSNLAFKFTSMTNGMTISDCHVYQSNIWLISTTGVKFIGGQYNCTSYFFQGSQATIFQGCVFPFSTYANTVNNNFSSSASTTKYIDCFHLDGRYATDPASFSTSRLAAVTANTTATVSKNGVIKSITIVNTTANAVTGGIKIGTTNGGTEVVAAQAVGANEILTISDASILKRIFSTSADTTLYIQAVTAWNSASLNIYFTYESPLY
jgi:hypothetical protein